MGIDSLKLDNCTAITGATTKDLFTAVAQTLNTATTGNPRKFLFTAPATLANSAVKP
ncbi:hypothetical protein [Arthrobacter sp. MA-N2]|uniref:hypothetical protein n=1 Tax=Arthrobacter sp. MA-N2 TaxID=1101188 RepID=UPI0004B640E7|nr:hypothetical protein [Arthrobacter sp. MA-N2]